MEIARLTTFRPDDGSASEVSSKPEHIVAAAQRRFRELEISLQSGRDDWPEVAKIVLRVLALYPRNVGEEDAAIRASGFVAVLEGLPVWAIDKAANRWARGKAHGQRPGWPPSVDELYQAASIELGPVAEERRTLKQFLDGKAPVIDAGPVRDIIGSGFDALSAELKTTATVRKAKETAISRELLDRANRQSFDAECEAHGMVGSNISPTLAAILRQQKECL